MSRLLVECGAARTRACLVDDQNVVLGFFFAPARGDEAKPRAVAPGQNVVGKITKRMPAMRGSFVDIGEPIDAFLPDREGGDQLTEGARGVFTVYRPAILEKGTVLKACATGLPAEVDYTSGAPLGVMGAPEDSVLEVLRLAGDVSAVSVNSADAAAIMRASTLAKGLDVNVADSLWADVNGDEAIEAALAPSEMLSSGTRMIFQETAGGCVVDIDGAAAVRDGVSTDAINLEAAASIPVSLKRRGIGGRVLIDFLPPSSKKAGEAFDKSPALKALGAMGRAHKRASGGVFDMTLARKQASLLEQASEITAAPDYLRRGRRLRPNWVACAAIEALEAALFLERSKSFTLRVGSEIMALIGDNLAWPERITDRFGARFEVTPGPSDWKLKFDVHEK
ncbi:MAG: ribonuclease E/G [Pseudomonadota bacterium]